MVLRAPSAEVLAQWKSGQDGGTADLSADIVEVILFNGLPAPTETYSIFSLQGSLEYRQKKYGLNLVRCNDKSQSTIAKDDDFFKMFRYHGSAKKNFFDIIDFCQKSAVEFGSSGSNEATKAAILGMLLRGLGLLLHQLRLIAQ